MKIISFDLEEWFHLLEVPGVNDRDKWNGFESRFLDNLNRILTILDETGTKATFFVLGWIVKKYPEAIRSLAEQGHEIGFHSENHELIWEMDRAGFLTMLQDGKHQLEDITGKPLNSFRAPGFSITDSCKWAFDALIESGFTVDASIFSGDRAHGGFRKAVPNKPFTLVTGSGSLLEFPMVPGSFLGYRLHMFGGGYFRLTPRWMLSQAAWRQEYVMTYLHPRDFDPDQPRIAELSPVRRFKAYVGLKSAERKLCQLLSQYQWQTIDEATASLQQLERVSL